jgi:hypothetical protein
MNPIAEQIQEDLLTFFDGLPDETLTHMCQIVVDNFRKAEELENATRSI